jgi:hypothetical protein
MWRSLNSMRTHKINPGNSTIMNYILICNRRMHSFSSPPYGTRHWQDDNFDPRGNEFKKMDVTHSNTRYDELKKMIENANQKNEALLKILIDTQKHVSFLHAYFIRENDIKWGGMDPSSHKVIKS